jgi:hypothetical protein
MYNEIKKPELIKGLKYWKNKGNRFAVAMLHYSADPDKDPKRQGKEWYENERTGTPKYTWAKEYEIDFKTKSGKLIFGPEFCDFDPKVHFINSYELPEPIDLLLSLDFGQRNPTCALVGAFTKDNKLFIIDEYYKPALPSVASREMFKHFEYLFGVSLEDKSIREKRDIANLTFSIKVIDPTTSSKNRSKVKFGEEVQYSILEEFEDNGWDFELGQNDVDGGITRIREYFSIDENGESNLYIFKDKCPNLCRELANYRYKEYKEFMGRFKNESEEPVKKDDHGPDSLRYMILTRPQAPKEAPKELTRIQKDIKNLLRPQVFNDWDIS